jgi:hypothetical protein
MVYKFVTKIYTECDIRHSLPSNYHPFAALRKDLAGHRFKDIGIWKQL